MMRISKTISPLHIQGKQIVIENNLQGSYTFNNSDVTMIIYVISLSKLELNKLVQQSRPNIVQRFVKAES